MKNSTSKSIDAYRVLFPLGVLFGVLGVSVWLAYAFYPGIEYPAKIHSELMMGAFLFSFAAGFLMTAIPKMTASFPAENRELAIAGGLSLAAAASTLANRVEIFYLVNSISILGLIVFFIRRFLARTKPIPPFFPFVLFGLVSGLSGSIILCFSKLIEFDPALEFFGRKLFFEGMILFLVLGIGSRLIPVISGRGVMDQPGLNSVIKNLSLSGMLIASFAFESLGWRLAGGVSKVFVVSWIAYFGWGIFSRSKTKSRLAFGMRTSGAMVWGGLVMSLVQPAFAVHWMHLAYVAGFGLMTLTVASRVTLAHGSYDLIFESKSKSLWVIGGLIFASAATRVAAPFVGAGYTMHLVYAAILWITALAIWGAVFLRRIFWKGDAAASC
jgi:uncharacterized protein involved in response to NO